MQCIGGCGTSMCFFVSSRGCVFMCSGVHSKKYVYGCVSVLSLALHISMNEEVVLI